MNHNGEESAPHWITDDFVIAPAAEDSIIVQCGRHMGSVFWRWVAEEKLIPICDGMYGRTEQ